jgi:hypothetical protein
VIPEEDSALIRKIAREPGYLFAGPGENLVEKWGRFDLMLRNELARLRASRRKKDPSLYLRSEEHADSEITHIASSAYRNTHILSAQEHLDKERWRFLEEASLGHYFDADTLCSYALKLAILIRWDKINKADAHALLNDTLKRN